MCRFTNQILLIYAAVGEKEREKNNKHLKMLAVPCNIWGLDHP